MSQSVFIPQERFMRLAIEKAREGVLKGNSPFGSCIVRGEEVIAVDHNVVWETTDITAHAEVTNLRHACSVVHGIDLTGCTIYTTTEPCPMCFTACHWARIGTIVYGTSIDDAATIGFNELKISNEMLKAQGGSEVKLVPHFLRDECLELFQFWVSHQKNPAY
jgi:tRNA(Arg) A34 adenosine deaminase TadA